MTVYGDLNDLREATSSLLVPLQMCATTEQPFRADVATGATGPVVTANISVTSGHVSRPRQMIASSDPHLVKVTLQRRGTATVTQSGRQCRVRPGELVAYDMSRPYEYAGGAPIDLTLVAMPWGMLGSSADLVARNTAIPVPGDRGLRSVIAAFFTALADDPAYGPGVPRLADAAASLLIAAFSDVPSERVELPTDLGGRIVAYALANLHDPDLTAAAVAHRFGISLRYLHTLMRRHDIRFTTWVRHERLRRIRRDLRDPRLATRTAAAIAARWGIHDPAHLSRTLRAEFGMSAAEIRRSALPF